MDVHDHLKVKIVEAVDLPNYQMTAPSPYVEVVVGQDRKRTKPDLETNNPKWNETPMIFEGILGEGVDSIMAYVYHKDAFSETPPCLGVAVIPMDTFYSAPKIEMEFWFDVLPDTDTEEMAERAKLRVQIIYNNELDEEFLAAASAPTSAPNLLQLTVHSASKLRARGAIEGLVQINVGSLRKQTKISKSSVEPHWEEVVEIPVNDGNSLIDVVLLQSTMIRNVFIGRVRIAMNEVASAGAVGLSKTFTLLNENFEFSETNRGELHLNAKWIFDAATEAVNRRNRLLYPNFGIFNKVAKLFRGKKTEVPEGAGEPETPEQKQLKQMEAQEEHMAKLGATYDMSPIELTMYLEEQRLKRREELEFMLAQQEEELEMPEGDYTVQVTVIEVDDLVGLNQSGMSDPIVYVECMGQKQHTVVVNEVSAAVFNQTFYFNFKGLKKDQLAEGSVKFSVYDYNYFRFNELIGVFQIDFQSVYAGKDHEVYRHWASLRDPNNPDDPGSQGLMKYSVAVLGPGDVQKIHDPCTEDEEAEADMEIKEGAGVPDHDSAGTYQNLHFLVLGCIKAQGLPGYDRLLSSVKTGLYTYVSLEFAGCKPMKTTKVAVSGKKDLAVRFDEELWIPVWVPTQCKRALITIKNREFGRWDQTIASAYVDFPDVFRCDKNPISKDFFTGVKRYNGPNLQWIHFYGANPLVRTGPKEAKFMNRFPNYGSAYRGSLLAALRVVKLPEGSTEAGHKVPIDDLVLPESLVPQGALYTLRVMIYQGCDFGSHGYTHKGKGPKYSVGLNIGPHSARSHFRQYENGYTNWIQLIELEDLPLPADYDQLPDSFITLYRGTENNHQSVSFARFKTAEILPLGTEPEAKWYELKHDLSHKQSSNSGYPGSVLMKISLMNIEDIVDKKSWEPERRKLEILKPYCLKVIPYN